MWHSHFWPHRRLVPFPQQLAEKGGRRFSSDIKTDAKMRFGA
jgi:hypothetical protein